jgi:hypothetical protein
MKLKIGMKPFLRSAIIMIGVKSFAPNGGKRWKRSPGPTGRFLTDGIVKSVFPAF